MHSRMGLKDQTEYLRPNLQKLTFTITLDCNYGVRPRAILDMLARHAERGDVYAFVVGGKRVGRYRWRITDLSLCIIASSLSPSIKETSGRSKTDLKRLSGICDHHLCFQMSVCVIAAMEAVERWEPRVIVTEVTFEADANGHLKRDFDSRQIHAAFPPLRCILPWSH